MYWFLDVTTSSRGIVYVSCIGRASRVMNLALTNGIYCFLTSIFLSYVWMSVVVWIDSPIHMTIRIKLFSGMQTALLTTSVEINTFIGILLTNTRWTQLCTFEADFQWYDRFQVPAIPIRFWRTASLLSLKWPQFVHFQFAWYQLIKIKMCIWVGVGCVGVWGGWVWFA